MTFHEHQDNCELCRSQLLSTHTRQVDIWASRKLVAQLIHRLQWRWHGIGLLQAYVHENNEGPELRVHVWSRDLMLPGIEESGNAHNHRFRLQSTVLAGSLLHTEWQVHDGEGFELYEFVHARLHTQETRAEMQRVTRLIDTQKRAVDQVAVTKVARRMEEGEQYLFDRGAYHSSVPLSPIVVTLCKKSDQVDEKARVIAPVGKPPVAAFSKDIDPELMGRILEQAQHALSA